MSMARQQGVGQVAQQIDKTLVAPLRGHVFSKYSYSFQIIEIAEYGDALGRAP